MVSGSIFFYKLSFCFFSKSLFCLGFLSLALCGFLVLPGIWLKGGQEGPNVIEVDASENP